VRRGPGESSRGGGDDKGGFDGGGSGDGGGISSIGAECIDSREQHSV
jgi:hypothetical protein